VTDDARFRDGLLKLLPRSLRTAVQYLPRVRHVLATEGLSVLLGKIRRRVGSTAVRVRRQPVLFSLHEPFQPLVFPWHGAVAVSIVVPVYNKFDYTHHCLAALHRHASRHSFEVVVVDDCSTDCTATRLAQYANVRVVGNAANQGFVRACNRGAEAARGEFLVFLNNDTQVQPGWLDELIGTFALRRDAGLVGSRLLYPDGRQQEAGGIVWRDGSAWNYGHLDEPMKPEYSYLRAADYCSGASLAIRRALFERLSGFDEHFAPAYYEDTDLAFRVRAAGYRVYYQPLSIVVHFEGVTSGTNVAANNSIKRFQAIHAEKFRARWQAVLKHHRARGVEPDCEKDRGIAGRVLVVDTYMLTPDRESGSLRMANLLSIFQQLGWQVTFGALGLDAREPYLSNLQRQGVECLYRPFVRSLTEHLRRHGERYDLVLLSRADSASALMADALRWCPKARVVYDTVDLHYLRVQREAGVHDDRRVARLGERRRREELELVRRAHTTFVVSEVERALLGAEVPEADVRLVSNIHEIRGSSRPFAERRDILFIGGFGHPPNRDAVLYFCARIFPLIRARLPEARFFVVGGDVPPEVQAFADDRVRILGYVPDVEPYFDRCRLSVAPLRFGAGVKGKVNQSLAHGLPVVVTSVAAEGMFLTDGVSALIADDPEAFAEAVIRLYADEALWARLSTGGLAVMEERFSFGAARRVIEQVVGP
jgi:GT2 family glycosyltransferase/glycosyltransferase involved in cell wall biosynthesis